MWCHKDFKKMIKVDSSKSGINIIDYTKKLADKDHNITEELTTKTKRKWKFNI